MLIICTIINHGFFKNGSGNTPLVKGTGNRHLTIVQFLIENGADPYIQNKMKETALTWTINNKQKEVEIYLKNIILNKETIII